MTPELAQAALALMQRVPLNRDGSSNTGPEVEAWSKVCAALSEIAQPAAGLPKEKETASTQASGPPK